MQLDVVKAFAIATLLLPFAAPAIAAPNEPKQPGGFTASCGSLTSGKATPNPVYTSDTICRRGLTPPSLWWIREQLGSQLGKKLISNWVATPATTTAQPGRLVVVVNSQAWSLLDYFSRYEFLHSFGLAANAFGYKTEVQDNRGANLASYVCSASSQSQTQPLQTTQPQGKDRCRIQLGAAASGFRGGSRSLF